MIKNFLITKNKTLKEAMKLINLNGQKCLIVVDKKNHLLGSLSDGDVRKVLLKNYKLEDKINDIYNKNPKFLFKKNLSEKKLKELFIKKNFDEKNKSMHLDEKVGHTKIWTPTRSLTLVKPRG